MKVFIITKVVGCRPLTLLKLTLSRIRFNSRECLNNVQLRSVALVMPVIRRSKSQNLFFLSKNAELNKQWIRLAEEEIG